MIYLNLYDSNKKLIIDYEWTTETLNLIYSYFTKTNQKFTFCPTFGSPNIEISGNLNAFYIMLFRKLLLDIDNVWNLNTFKETAIFDNIIEMSEIYIPFTKEYFIHSVNMIIFQFC